VQAVIRLYDIPNNTFESDESDSESSSEEEDEEPDDDEEEEGAVEPQAVPLENGTNSGIYIYFRWIRSKVCKGVYRVT